MRPLILLLAICLPACFPCSLQAQALEADRPDQTETPAIVPRKHFQFEMGFIYEEDKQVDLMQQSFTYPTLLAKYGVNKNFELRLIIEHSGTSVKNQGNKTKIRGLAPLQIGLKAKLLEEKGIVPQTSLIMHVALPGVASQGLRSNYVAPNFRLVMQHTLSENISLSYNLGAEWDGVSPASTGIYTLTSGFKLSEKWGTYIELYGFLPEQSVASHSFDGGICFYPRPNIMLDISAGFGINEYAPDYFVGCGFSLRLPD